MTDTITQVACFKIGNKVAVGEGTTVWTITGFIADRLARRTLAIVTSAKRKQDAFDVAKLSLLGPNGDGKGA